LKRTESPEAQLETFLAKYTPEIAGRAKAALQKMRKRLPGAAELVYDNYNALVIGFAPGARPSHAIFSIALTRAGSTFFPSRQRLARSGKAAEGQR
jgi:ABC-type uncharacterized transport system permease subunit